MFPDRFDADGNKMVECETLSGDIVKKYGEEACAPVIEEWKATVGTVCEGTEACNAAISCRAGNDAAGAELTTANDCDLVTLKYGYSQW